MAANFKLFLRKAVVTPGATPTEVLIQRPSVLEMHIRVYTCVLCGVENHLDLDVNELLREVLLGEVYARPIGRIGRADWFPEGDIDFGEAMIGTITAWYSDFITRKVPTGATFSPLRMGFTARGNTPLRPEEYTDYAELQALVRIVGVYGVKLIEREILRHVLGLVAGLKEGLALNAAVLEEINAAYHKEAKCNEALKKLRDVDNFITRSIAIGSALEMRKLLHDATRTVAQEKAPYIFSVINTMFEQYARNTFLFPDLIPVDIMAIDVGVDVETADQPLKVMLKRASPEADKKLWDLLATMYAASFASSAAWREAQFKPLLEGHVNNVHCLATAINDLIVAFGVVTGEEDISNQLYKYVEISSMILLRMARAKPDRHTPADFPSVIIFLDRFVEASPLITKDVLERCMPYALLRNMYKVLYQETLAPGTRLASSAPEPAQGEL